MTYIQARQGRAAARGDRVHMAISSNFIYLIIAILLSPIIGVFASSLARDMLLLLTIDFNSWVHNIPAFLISGIARSFLGLVVSLPVVLLYGVPVFYFLKKRNWHNVWMFALFALFGLLPTVMGTLVSLFTTGQTLESHNTYTISASTLDGPFTAIIFWFFAVYIPSRRSRES